MKSNIGVLLLCVAIGFVLGFFLLEPNKETKILRGMSTTKIDTILVDKPYPVVKIVTKEVDKPYKEVILDTVYMVNKKSYYKDTINVEKDLHLTYDLTTIGKLDSIKLGYIDNRPDKIVKETIVKSNNGLYIGGTTSLNFNTSVGVVGIRNKNMIGVSVNLNSQSFSSPTKYNFSYHRRLF